VNIVLEIYDLFGDITKTVNDQVTWLSNFAERILNSKKLKYKRYNDFFKNLDSSARVWEIIKLDHSAQRRKTRATKKLRDLWQHYPKIKEILSDSSGSEKWMRLTAITIETSRHPKLVKRCLNHA